MKNSLSKRLVNTFRTTKAEISKFKGCYKNLKIMLSLSLLSYISSPLPSYISSPLSDFLFSLSPLSFRISLFHLYPPLSHISLLSLSPHIFLPPRLSFPHLYLSSLSPFYLPLCPLSPLSPFSALSFFPPPSLLSLSLR